MGALCWLVKVYFFIRHVTKVSAKHKLEMAGEESFFRGQILDLLLKEENEEALDKIFDPFFMEATVEVGFSLFCKKFMKRDVCKYNFELLKSYSQLTGHHPPT